MSNLDLQIKILGDDLERLQQSLSKYEELLIKKESLNYAKEMIEYYRSQSKSVRLALLKLMTNGDNVVGQEQPVEPTEVVPPETQPAIFVGKAPEVGTPPEMFDGDGSARSGAEEQLEPQQEGTI